MSFRLVPKSVTLNDLEWRILALILRYFTEFVDDVVVKQLPRFQNLLLIIYDHSICAIIIQRLFGQKTNSDNSV